LKSTIHHNTKQVQVFSKIENFEWKINVKSLIKKDQICIKKKGLRPNTKFDLVREDHNWKIENLRTKNEISSLLKRKRGGRQFFFKGGEGEV
jgi:hypothetical protein